MLKANYKYNEKTNIYADLQRRSVKYEFEGPDENGNTSKQEIALIFLILNLDSTMI